MHLWCLQQDKVHACDRSAPKAAKVSGNGRSIAQVRGGCGPSRCALKNAPELLMGQLLQVHVFWEALHYPFVHLCPPRTGAECSQVPVNNGDSVQAYKNSSMSDKQLASKRMETTCTARKFTFKPHKLSQSKKDDNHLPLSSLLMCDGFRSPFTTPHSCTFFKMFASSTRTCVTNNTFLMYRSGYSPGGKFIQD